MARERKPQMDMIIPYEQYCKLVKELEQVPQLRRDLKRLTEQHEALYRIVFETIDTIGEIKKYI